MIQDQAAILTARTTLVPITVEDADEMAVVLGASDLHEFIGGAPLSPAEMRRHYEALVVGRSADGTEEWRNWVIRRRADGRAVGTVQATVLDDGRRAYVAWVVGLPWQGQGYASEAARALADWLVARGATWLAAAVHPDHHASAAVARHAGLTATGELDEDGEQLWVWTETA